MNKLTIDNILKNSICIFVDASILNTEKSFIGCPGCLIVNGEQISYSDYIRLDSTNSRSELAAVQLGVTQALNYINSGVPINLFSDSKVCIYSIREWIFNWCNNIVDGVLYGSSYKPISNQDMIINIINTIRFNNLHINLYHQKGHVDIFNKHSLEHAREVFIESNKVDIEYDLLKYISDYNNNVDIQTKMKLEHCNGQNRKLVNPIRFSLDGFDKYKYRELVRRDL